MSRTLLHNSSSISYGTDWPFPRRKLLSFAGDISSLSSDLACRRLDPDLSCYQLYGPTFWPDLWYFTSLPVLSLQLSNSLFCRRILGNYQPHHHFNLFPHFTSKGMPFGCRVQVRSIRRHSKRLCFIRSIRTSTTTFTTPRANEQLLAALPFFCDGHSTSSHQAWFIYWQPMDKILGSHVSGLVHYH